MKSRQWSDSHFVNYWFTYGAKLQLTCVITDDIQLGLGHFRVELLAV